MVASHLLRAAALVAVCGFGSPAFAQADTLTSVLKVIGLAPDDKEPIEYRERAPLVVPPSVGKLRAPEEAVDQKTANWPQDPDVLARKRKAEEAKQPVARVRANNDDAKLPLAVGQQRNRYAGVPTTGLLPISQDAQERASIRVNREDVGRILAANKAQNPSLRPGEEPVRQYLTEPPKGYRQGAAGAPVRATIDPIRNSDEVEFDALKAQRR